MWEFMAKIVQHKTKADNSYNTRFDPLERFEFTAARTSPDSL